MSTTEFKLETLADALEKCQLEDNTLSMDAYLESYNEVTKFLYLLGKAFVFVGSEVNSKVSILYKYRNSSDGENYVTINRMMQYEIENEITTKNSLSGCRTLLRLHRAFEFVMEFIKQMRHAAEDVKLSVLTQKAYDDTLAKFHPWLVKQGVYIAMYTLPKKAQLVAKLKTEEDDNKQIDRVIEHSRIVYDTLQQLFVENELDDLP
ncbi:ceramide-1-phosphate transfer protein-like [Octopus sinensis]|uniref:Ceramide-1-phosphate transfer protein-like n=1 Tax=Octopus sinensis TaxID=2607531 RepID=A0A6P7TIV2_9MOLL|nr:ceramide-1-phosphate transfer protein-like [Octopus sinensis]